MKRWAAVVCAATLANCAAPQISVTDASPRRVEFLVQSPTLVPMQDVDEQAAAHCRQRGLWYQKADAVWVGPTAQRVTYECIGAEQSPMPPTKARPRPARAAQPAEKTPRGDPKASAWAKARAATHSWARCLQRVATRKAKETSEALQLIAREVVDACAEQEHAVHEPLIAIGEDSSSFQADMHAQAVQNAADAVRGIRTAAGEPAVEPAGSRSDERTVPPLP
ncbi:MAG TPA: hypothetical protein VE690_19685 [Rhodopila sp.]|nr:hypothetical protein [Rhodopila sp.]